MILTNFDPSNSSLAVLTQSEISSERVLLLTHIETYTAVLIASDLYIVYSQIGLDGLYLK